jgi:hypothetical protein
MLDVFFFPELCHLFLGLGYVNFPHQFTAGSQELQHTRMLGFEAGNDLLPITRCQKKKKKEKGSSHFMSCLW